MKQKMIKVLWDGDTSGMNSHYSHVEFASEQEATDSEGVQSENQAASTMAHMLISSMQQSDSDSAMVPELYVEQRHAPA